MFREIREEDCCEVEMLNKCQLNRSDHRGCNVAKVQIVEVVWTKFNMFADPFADGLIHARIFACSIFKNEIASNQSYLHCQ